MQQNKPAVNWLADHFHFPSTNRYDQQHFSTSLSLCERLAIEYCLSSLPTSRVSSFRLYWPYSRVCMHSILFETCMYFRPAAHLHCLAAITAILLLSDFLLRANRHGYIYDIKASAKYRMGWPRLNGFSDGYQFAEQDGQIDDVLRF